MKKEYVMTAFGVVAALFSLQISCAGMNQKSEVTASAAVETAEEETGLLADTHKTTGISCSDCHSESPPATAVSEAACLNCHEDYMDLTVELYADPHNGHVVFQDCGNCHHVHQESENQCLACHMI